MIYLQLYHIVNLFIILSYAFRWNPNVDYQTHPGINVSKQGYNFVEVS